MGNPVLANDNGTREYRSVSERTMALQIIRFASLFAALILASAGSSANAQKPNTPTECVGLHAGITAELTKGYSEPSVMVAFVLLNDATTDRGTAPESWKLMIDGHELDDSGMIFGNGPSPSEGYGTLRSGAMFQFGKALPISKYFPEHKEYRISWKSRYFQSPTVKVKVP